MRTLAVRSGSGGANGTAAARHIASAMLPSRPFTNFLHFARNSVCCAVASPRAGGQAVQTATTLDGTEQDEAFMRLALAQARNAFDAGEVPVGAVLVVGADVVAATANATEAAASSLAHAELLALLEGTKVARNWRLSDATLYCTLEPCPMCAGAMLQARLGRLVYGARQPRLGADGSWVALLPRSEQQAPAGGVEMTADARAYEQADACACIEPVGPHPFHPRMAVSRGVLEAECSDIMIRFFQKRRAESASDSTDSDSGG